MENKSLTICSILVGIMLISISVFFYFNNNSGILNKIYCIDNLDIPEEPVIFNNSSYICTDGQGSGIYVFKDDFMDALDRYPSQNEYLFAPYQLNITFFAVEHYNCGDTSYSIRSCDGTYKNVNYENFNNYIAKIKDLNKSHILKVHSSGNSPIFIEDLSPEEKYFLSFNETTNKYFLKEQIPL